MADGEEEDAFEEQSFRVPAADEEEALLAVDPDDYYALLNVSRDVRIIVFVGLGPLFPHASFRRATTRSAPPFGAPA